MAGSSVGCRHLRTRIGTEWAIALTFLLVMGLAVMASFVWASSVQNGTKLLTEATIVGVVVGTLLGGVLPGQLCRGRVRTVRGGWKIAFGPKAKCTAVRLQQQQQQRAGTPRSAVRNGREETPRGAQQHLPGRKHVSFSPRVGVRPMPNLCECPSQWKMKLWWQPEDFAEFLRVRVLIGRAYRAVAKRRGVKLGSDFPAEPVLAHESRLGLHLGRQSCREKRRRNHISHVLEEQRLQRKQEENGCSVDIERLARAARKASRRDREEAIEQAKRHREKILQDLNETQAPGEDDERWKSSLNRAQDMRRLHSMPSEEVHTPTASSSESPWPYSYSCSESSNVTTPEQATPFRRNRRARTLPDAQQVVDAIAKAVQKPGVADLGAYAESDVAGGPSRLDKRRLSRSLLPARQLSQIAERQLSENPERQSSEASSQRQLSESSQRPPAGQAQQARSPARQANLHAKGTASSAPCSPGRSGNLPTALDTTSAKLVGDAAQALRLIAPRGLGSPGGETPQSARSPRPRTLGTAVDDLEAGDPSPGLARQRSPSGLDTRGFGLPRGELEKAGLSATGHLLRHTASSKPGSPGPDEQSSEDGRRTAAEDSDCTVDSEARMEESGEEGDATGGEDTPPLTP